ncbi:terminase large subunit, partial [Burkholderia pseudomallei]|uniref:terminase TerL endonuclease subunit n=1 Tax=Burkholderia pseudomallei TaxID=28450 RepID=UPI0013AD2208
AKKAKEQVAARPNFFTKHLNIWVTAESAWMDMDRWAKMPGIASEAERKAWPLWVGVDLANKIDICAAVKAWRDPTGETHMQPRFWIPEGRLETAPAHIAELYRKWADAGYLELTDGDVIDHGMIKADIVQWVKGENIKEIAFDPWSAVQFSLSLAEEGLPLVEVAQTVKNLSESMKSVQAEIYGNKFHHDDNPVMRWMMSNVTVKPDKNDNIFPNKSTPENKIDGPVALFTAKSRMLVNGGNDAQDLSGFF